MDLLKRTWAEIDLDHLEYNYHQLRRHVADGCRFLGVVKADAYGHGAVQVSHTLEELGADYLAVSNLEEAVQLRRAAVRLPVLLLGYTPPRYAAEMAQMNVHQEIHSLEYAQRLSQRLEGTGLRLPVHWKVDTGMSRLGVSAEDPAKALDELLQIASLAYLPISPWPILWTRRTRPIPRASLPASRPSARGWRTPGIAISSATAPTPARRSSTRTMRWI